MSKKKIVQLLAILFLILAVAFLIPNTTWTENTSVLCFISLVLGTLGSTISIFIPRNYILKFADSDWIKNKESNGYNLLINVKKHGMGGSPQIQTFIKNDKNFEEIATSFHYDIKGNITIGANITFIGKVIIT